MNLCAQFVTIRILYENSSFQRYFDLIWFDLVQQTIAHSLSSERCNDFSTWSESREIECVRRFWNTPVTYYIFSKWIYGSTKNTGLADDGLRNAILWECDAYAHYINPYLLYIMKRNVAAYIIMFTLFYKLYIIITLFDNRRTFRLNLIFVTVLASLVFDALGTLYSTEWTKK